MNVLSAEKRAKRHGPRLLFEEMGFSRSELQALPRPCLTKTTTPASLRGLLFVAAP